MASVEHLSDAELRLKLSQLGYPVGPITATTRKVLVKKLKHLETEQAESLGNEKSGRSLSRYSSEEDSEDDTSRTRRRRSMPPPPPKSPQKIPKRRSLGRQLQDESPTRNLGNQTTDFISPSASSTLNSSDASSVFSRFQKHSPKSTNYGHTESKFNSFSSQYSRKPHNEVDLELNTDKNNDFENRLKNLGSSSSIYTGLSSGSNASPGRSRFYQPLGDNEAFKLKTSGLNHDSNLINSPFSSEYMRKLASTTNKSGHGVPSRYLDVKESDDEDISTPQYSQHNIGNIKRGKPIISDGSIWKSTTLWSGILLALVACFFCGLAVIYLGVRYKDNQLSTSDAIYPVCKLGEKPGKDCVLRDEITGTMNIFTEIYQVLHEKAVQHTCDANSDSSALNESELSQILVHKLPKLSLWDIEKNFGNIKVIIEVNPQWGVQVNKSNDKDVFQIASPNLPIGCYLISFFYGIVGTALKAILVVAIMAGVARGYIWWSNKQELNKKEVFKMVESVIDILSSHQQNNEGENFLPISHVRDQLIPPHKRDKMADVWNKTVAYLEENESRVRTEVQQVMGEEFRVWRWLSAPRTNGKRKVWQGQAFETMEGSVNSLPISPTPCLKIRHMFDSGIEAGEDWMTRVQDAILEKCDGVDVVHVAVDKNSHEGCVYVKCASSLDAGRAYRALHGSWFDSKLVTVKYLRLERYHERFPEANQAVQPLVPSNDRKLSLQ